MSNLHFGEIATADDKNNQHDNKKSDANSFQDDYQLSIFFCERKNA